jgi:hypothetical protein
MNTDGTEINWIAERLPDAPAPDELTTARARQALMAHLGDPARDTDVLVAATARQPRWRRSLKLGVVGASIAAAAFIGINLTGSSGSSGGGGPAVATAASIKEQVMAVLQPATPGSIQEVDEIGHFSYSDHPSSSYEYHVWTQLGGGEVSRIVQNQTGTVTGQDETGNNFQEVYDSFDNTIYRIDHGLFGDYISGIEAPILQQLQNPNSVVDNSATFDGRPAIKITLTQDVSDFGESSHSTTVTYVQPGTLVPLESTVTAHSFRNGQPDESSTATMEFPVWRTLTGSAALPALVSLSAQHPSASTKVVDQQTFNQVDRQMHPHG